MKNSKSKKMESNQKVYDATYAAYKNFLVFVPDFQNALSNLDNLTSAEQSSEPCNQGVSGRRHVVDAGL